jgi:hypothetical protein
MALKKSYFREIGRRLWPDRRWGQLPNRVHLHRGVARKGHLPNIVRRRRGEEGTGGR